MTYFLFLSASIISDGLFILGMTGLIHLNLTGFGAIIWLIAIVMFILSIMVAISTEKGELTFKNIIIIFLMYFFYCKLWAFVALLGFYNYIKDILFKREVKWYKTERF